MNRDLRFSNRLLLVSLLSCGACRSPSSDAPQPPHAAPPPVEQAAPPPSEPGAPSVIPPAPPPPKPDPIDPVSLKAGLTTMEPRIVVQTEAAAKIAPTEQFRLFMHPGEAKDAVVEFNTKGLSSLELSPFIQDFGGNSACVDDPAAGIVKLTWSTDGGKKNSLTVDRTYSSTVAVNVAKSSKLKLEVDKGNGTALCDWFSVGLLNVK